MEIGKVVEFIDRQKIMCAVVLQVKKQRLRVLTEVNREVNLSESRLLYKSDLLLDLGKGRDMMVAMLKRIAARRYALITEIDMRALWEVLNSEQEWIDLETMTAFCFPRDNSSDHQSAVVRAFFENRRYFRFNSNRFFPYTESQVELTLIQAREKAQKEKLIQKGADWIHSLQDPAAACATPDESQQLIDIFKSYYLFEQDSPYADVGKAILSRVDLKLPEDLFSILVGLKVYNETENVDLERYGIEVNFPDDVMQESQQLTQNAAAKHDNTSDRRDLSDIPLMTIDGQSTLDFDDAISIENYGEYVRVGVHIADVGHYIPKGQPIDQEAFSRASSIYTPDLKISMLPPILAEGLCSLKVGQLRPAISTMIRITPNGDIIDYEIFPSTIKVTHQLSYYDVNLMAEDNKGIVILKDIADKFRRFRLDHGAIQISLPDINVWVNDEGSISVNKISRESPSRLLVSELMIMANWCMASFLEKKKLPAIFRSQPAPRERLYRDEEGSLFQNWMQRRLLSRFILASKAEKHAGLGLDAYVTATSPIRKYFDLVTQRQLRSHFGLQTPYATDEMEKIISVLEVPMRHVSRIQFGRNRFWLLKHLEGKIGMKQRALVLQKRRSNYRILLTEYMLECDLPISCAPSLKPEDMIQVALQHVNARMEKLSVFMV